MKFFEKDVLLMERAILHSDLNCFYASVEMMLDPSLRGKAVAVCGSTEDRHGIVLAKSEKAKKAGVKTGMVNWEARQQCPDLIVVPPQYDQYLKYSKLTQAIYQRYTDLIEPFGMDECWLDVTGSRMVCGDAMTIAENIRRSVREELGLTVSIGVSYNKIFAKLGSDMRKPDAITEICKDTFKDIGHRLRLHELSAYGVQIAVRSNDLFGSQYQCKIPYKTQLPSEIAATAFRLFKENYQWNKNVRAIAVRAINLVPQNQPDQLSLFVDTQKLIRREKLEDVVEELRGRFGKHAITYGALMGNLKMPDDGRDAVKMPGMMYQ